MNIKHIWHAFSQVYELREAVSKLTRRVYELENSTPIAQCDVCGCLLAKDAGIRGKAELREQEVSIDNLVMIPIRKTELRIFYPNYCKVHAPKTKKTKSNKNQGDK